MDPTRADGNTLLALVPLRLLDVVDRSDMGAACSWHRQKRIMRCVRSDTWPELPYDAWKDTYATLHMWTQIVGKLALAHSPPLNHSWGVAMQVTARGLATRLLHHGDLSFTVEFDFLAHELFVRTSEGDVRSLKLTPRTVADFYREFVAILGEMGIPMKVWPVSVEVPDPIRFDEDRTHRAYSAEYAQRFWRILVQCERVFTEARADFIGKCSPVHFFWGSFDLAVTRFSGRPAPSREGPAFMREAYSQEVISHGFWPGSGPVLEPAFYAYSVPEPKKLRAAPIQPREAYYHAQLSEFVLPYAAVRNVADPDRALHQFIESTYSQAAALAGWDRASLERPRDSRS